MEVRGALVKRLLVAEHFHLFATEKSESCVWYFRHFLSPLICLSPPSSVVWIKHNLFRVVMLLIIRHHAAQAPDRSKTAAAAAAALSANVQLQVHTVSHCTETGFIIFYYHRKIKHLRQNACRCSVPQRCDYAGQVVWSHFRFFFFFF